MSVPGTQPTRGAASPRALGRDQAAALRIFFLYAPAFGAAAMIVMGALYMWAPNRAVVLAFACWLGPLCGAMRLERGRLRPSERSGLVTGTAVTAGGIGLLVLGAWWFMWWFAAGMQGMSD